MADATCELSHFLCDAASTSGFDEGNGKTPEPSDVFRSISCSYPAAVFVVVPVDYVMATVFDTPVATIYSKDTFRVGLLGSLAG